jgi:hypothetical protein
VTPVARRSLAVSALMLGVVLAAILVADPSCRRGTDAQRAPARALAPPSHREIRYAFSWRGHSDASGGGTLTQLGADSARGEITLAGELAIRRLDAHTLGLRFTRLDEARVLVYGQELLGDDGSRALVGHELAISIDGNGAATDFAVAPDAPPALLSIGRALALQLHVDGGAGASTYEVQAQDLFGTVTFAYRARGDELQRTRVRYQHLDAVPLDDCRDCTQSVTGAATIALRPDGMLARLHDREELVVIHGSPVLRAENELLVEAIGEATAAARPAFSSWRRVPATGVLEDHASRLREIAGDLRFADIDGWITTMAATGARPAGAGWLLQACALLELEPAHVGALGARFRAAELPSGARMLVLDLLANTRGARAQAALRGALDHAVTFGDDTYAAMLNRLMVVREPDDATVAWVSALRERSSDRSVVVRGTALYVEGAVIGEFAKVDHDAAVARSRELVDELASTRDLEQRAHVIAAVGNTRLAEVVDVLVGEAAHGDPRVRAAAARALDGIPSPAAADALVALTADAAPDVQAAALHALSHGPVDDRHIEAVAAAVVSGAPAGADAELLDLLARGAGRIGGVRAAVAHMLARNLDPALAARAHALLDG